MLQKTKDLVFDAVVILFVTLAILLACEIGVRLATRKPPPPPFLWSEVGLNGQARVQSKAYAAYPWAKDFDDIISQKTGRRGLRYEPFSLWKQYPYQNKYVTYQENGYRKTINPQKQNCKRHQEVWVFGGSTIGGDGFLRDIDVIPSQLSIQLNAAYPDDCIDVRNYGVSGFNQGNEFVLFMNLLSVEKKPDLVIFYDGYNDVYQRVIDGEPHMAYWLFQRVISGAEPQEDPSIWRMLVKKSRLISLFIKKPLPLSPEAELTRQQTVLTARASDMATLYAGHSTVAQATAKALGIKLLIALQPTLFQKKPRTDEENKIYQGIGVQLPLLEQFLDQSYTLIRDQMNRPDLRPSFADVSDLMNGSDSIYVDMVHVSPLGNQLAAERLTRLIAERHLL